MVVVAGGAALRGPGDDGLLWLSLARSLGRWSCCRRFSMSWWRRPTLWLSCCRRFSMSWCRRTTLAVGRRRLRIRAAALPGSALLCSATARHDQPALESPRPPGTAARSVSRGASQGRRGPTTCCGSCAVSGELRRADGRTLAAGTTASSVLQAAAGSVGLLAGAPSRRLPDRARLPACLLPVTVLLPGVESAALLLVNQQSARPSPSQPASPLLDDPALRPPVLTACHPRPLRRRAGMADKAEGAGLGEGKGSLLLSTRHPTLALALADGCCVALPAADRGTAARLVVATTGRPGTGGARGHKKRKKRAEGRWGPLLRWSAGDQRPPFRRARADGQHPA